MADHVRVTVEFEQYGERHQRSIESAPTDYNYTAEVQASTLFARLLCMEVLCEESSPADCVAELATGFEAFWREGIEHDCDPSSSWSKETARAAQDMYKAIEVYQDLRNSMRMRAAAKVSEDRNKGGVV